MFSNMVSLINQKFDIYSLIFFSILFFYLTSSFNKNFLSKQQFFFLRFDETKPRNASTVQQRSFIEPSQAPVDEVLFSTMDDAPSKEVEVFKQPFPCMNEQLYNRITEAIQTDDLNQVEKVKN
jgi:hypothetical protein